MRKLATIRVISSITPIKGKDRIELAQVDGWQCVVKKEDNFKAGSRCVFCEVDSVFPAIPKWEFLKNNKYRIKTIRFKDEDGKHVYSQGLVLPMSSIGSHKADLGDDVTSILGITKYDPETVYEVPANLPKSFSIFKTKKDVGFPIFVPKTEEERIQNMPYILTYPILWTATEKLDGTSATYAVVKHKRLFNRYEFIVCSRNKRVYDTDSFYHEMAEKYDIKNKLTKYLKDNRGLDWVAIQGEIIGPKIQGNKYKLKENDLYIFNLRNSTHERCGMLATQSIMNNMGFKTVPIVKDEVSMYQHSIEDVVEMSKGESQINKVTREGLVFRSINTKPCSFKVINPEFLIKHKQ